MRKSAILQKHANEYPETQERYIVEPEFSTEDVKRVENNLLLAPRIDVNFVRSEGREREILLSACQG